MTTTPDTTKLLAMARDWQAIAQREASECLGTPEGAARLAESKRYGMLMDALAQASVPTVAATPEREALAAEVKRLADEAAKSEKSRFECERYINVYEDSPDERAELRRLTAAAEGARAAFHAVIDALAASPAAGVPQPMNETQLLVGSNGLATCIDDEYLKRGDWREHALRFVKSAISIRDAMWLAATPPAAPAPQPEAAEPVPAPVQPVATAFRGGSKLFGRATILQAWLPAADALPCGEHLLYATPPAPAQQSVEKDAARWLTKQDYIDLCGLDDEFSDGDGWTLPKARMQRLAEIGVVRRTSGNIYSITSFGMRCLTPGGWPLPLRTAEEYNEQSRQQAAALAQQGDK